MAKDPRRHEGLDCVADQTDLPSQTLRSSHFAHAAGHRTPRALRGQGGKKRCPPLRKDSVAALRSWLKENGSGPDAPVFPNRAGGRLSHDWLAYILAKHVAAARKACPSLNGKRVTPHVLRHTAAMELLQDGVARSVIALWWATEAMPPIH